MTTYLYANTCPTIDEEESLQFPELSSFRGSSSPSASPSQSPSQSPHPEEDDDEHIEQPPKPFREPLDTSEEDSEEDSEGEGGVLSDGTCTCTLACTRTRTGTEKVDGNEISSQHTYEYSIPVVCMSFATVATMIALVITLASVFLLGGARDIANLTFSASCQSDCHNHHSMMTCTRLSTRCEAYESQFNLSICGSCQASGQAIWQVVQEAETAEEQQLEVFSRMSLVDRFALYTLYLSTSATLPLHREDPCVWDEIICDENGNVMVLELSNADLKGTLPTELGLMLGLRNLALERNQLSGTITSHLCNLTKLRRLSLSHNHIEGSLPAAIGQLTHLSHLDLHDNLLSSAVFTHDLQHLRVLQLSANLLTGSLWIPHSSLRTVILSDNDFEGVTVDSESLLLLDLSRNERLHQMSAFDSLERLYLSGLSRDLVHLWPQRFEQLSHLDLSGCELRSFPVLSTSDLVYLNLSSSALIGNLPGNWSQPLLEVLDLSQNDFIGTIPSTWEHMQWLDSINLKGNDGLSGVVPVDLCGIVELDDCHGGGCLGASCQ